MTNDKSSEGNPSEILFMLLMFIIITLSAVGSGFYYVARSKVNTIPPTELASRKINVELNGKDTVRVTITDKFIYHYQSLSNEQKEELRKEIK